MEVYIHDEKGNSYTTNLDDLLRRLRNTNFTIHKNYLNVFCGIENCYEMSSFYIDFKGWVYLCEKHLNYILGLLKKI